MNNELKQLIELVKTSPEPVQTVVQQFFQDTTWSLLKHEWLQMSEVQKAGLISKLQQERK